MRFETASAVEDCVWSMKMADLPRAENRAQINELANGSPPYTEDEVIENNIQTNVNFLEATKQLLDARRQFTNGFIKPGNFFNVTLEYGPTHKRGEWAKLITKTVNATMKGSLKYLECLRSQFAGVVLHGIGPSYWPDRERWMPQALGIEDVLIPSGTLLSMDNLQHFAVFRQFTVPQLWKLTRGPKVDPAWNLPLVKKAMHWAVSKYTQDVGFAEIYTPEKMEENFKQDLGMYASDAVPTIDSWDFYFFNDAKKNAGWNRRIILDTPATDGTGPYAVKLGNARSVLDTRGDFLYDAGDRVYGRQVSEIIHFQFGDLSAVPPFRYHSVRSLGYLIYAISHLQNRLRSKFMDHVFESLMQYFRIGNQDEFQRLRKINLQNYGVVPNDLTFVPQTERWQIDQALIENAIEYNRMLIGDQAAPFTAETGENRPPARETATKTAMKAQAASQMVSALLSLAYEYQEHQYREICRRFCIKNSKDADVRAFRLKVMKEGVPPEALCVDYWKIDAERVLGGGNKIIELQEAQQLMAARPLYDPESQRMILRDFTLATTDDPGRTEQLVPMEPDKLLSDSFHDAQVGFGTLMAGGEITPKGGMNTEDYIRVWLAKLGQMVIQNQQQGGMAPPDKLMGYFNIAKHIEQYIALLAQDPEQKQKVKQYSDGLGQIQNLLKAFAQRLQEIQKKQMEANGAGQGVNPQDIAKAQISAAQAQQKMQQSAMSHAQRTQQRQTNWEIDQARKQKDHELNLRREFDRDAAERRQRALETAQNLAEKAAEPKTES